MSSSPFLRAPSVCRQLSFVFDDVFPGEKRTWSSEIQTLDPRVSSRLLTPKTTVPWFKKTSKSVCKNERLTRKSGLELNADMTEILSLHPDRTRTYDVEFNGVNIQLTTMNESEICGIWYCNMAASISLI